MMLRFSLYVEVEADSPTDAIVRALTTIVDEKRWGIRVTGIQYAPHMYPGGGLIGPVGGMVGSFARDRRVAAGHERHAGHGEEDARRA